MIRTKIPFLLLVLLLGNALQARDFWLEKDYRRWSEKECRKLLTNSPWSKRYTLTQAHIEMIGATPSSDRQRERNAKIEYHVQLRSAPPLRQAQVRLAQIRSNYEAMSPEKRKGFDNQAAQILRDSFDDLVGYMCLTARTSCSGTGNWPATGDPRALSSLRIPLT